MTRFIPAGAWTLLLYALTVITAGLPVAPTVSPHATAIEVSRSVWWFEFNHAVLHAATFAVLARLLIFANKSQDLPALNKSAFILGIALVVGVGQETLQSAMRSRVVFWNSSFDVMCDVGGATLFLVAAYRKAKA